MNYLSRRFLKHPRLAISMLLLAFCLLSLSTIANAQFWSQKANPLLPEDQAFSVTALIDDSGLLRVHWSIADDYYMYRDQFSVQTDSAGVSIGDISFPEGVVEDDPEFGEVTVYFYNAELTGALTTSNPAGPINLILKGQGCNKPVGVCYPPMVRTVSVDLSNTALTAINSRSATQNTGNSSGNPGSVNTQLQNGLEKSFLAYVISAFFAGILLSFTPCVLPMIPILAGVIAGQKQPSRLQSGWLAICYVAGTIVTYIVAGAVAGATGAQLQAYFQNVWVIFAICALLLALAGSLFGWYKIELPSSIQTRLSGSSVSTKSASFSSFALGLISALVVGACVSPILIIALGAAITQGDPVLGAAIMGSMAFGMGLLLILFGFGAGWILPRAGAWMTQVQIIFGFMVLGVAIYLLSGLPFIPSLFLWSGLLLLAGFYCWNLVKDIKLPLAASLIQAISAVLILWGAMALVGGSQNGSDILNPLESLSLSSGGNSESGGDPRTKLNLTTVTTLAETTSLLQQAKQQGQPVLIDFYADWCLDCKRMHRTTFKSLAVQEALKSWKFIEIDVTDTSDASETVKRHFQVFGPPATLFYNSNGQENSNLRQYGFIKEQDFLKMLSQVN